MDLTLALVTCGPQLEVALAGGRLPAPSLVRLAGISPRSTLLLAAADLLLEDLGVSPQDLRRVLVSRGPGSFTGIRAGLAGAAGLQAATNATCLAYGSLTMQAARCTGPGPVWAAQPGRRGEVYAQQFTLAGEGPPQPIGEIRTMAVTELDRLQPWVAADALDLGAALRAATARSAAEALLLLATLEMPGQPLQPLYIDPPPVAGLVS